MGGLKCGKSVDEIYPRESTWPKEFLSCCGIESSNIFENMDFFLHTINVKILNTSLQNGVCLGEMKCLPEFVD